MKEELKVGSVNQIMKGSDIYQTGDDITSVALVVKGKIRVHGRGLNLSVGSGSFLGIWDISRGVHGVTYTAETNAVIYVFEVSGTIHDMRNIIEEKSDYGALMVSFLCRSLAEQEKKYDKLRQVTGEAYDIIMDLYDKYIKVADQSGIVARRIKMLEKLDPFDEMQFLPEDKLRYYQACNQVAPEIQKAFFGTSAEICMYHIKEQINLAHQMHDYSLAQADYLEDVLKPIILEENNLYAAMADVVRALQRSGLNSQSIFGEMDRLIDCINSMETALIECADITVNIDRDYMENIYFELLNPGGQSAVVTMETMDSELALVDDIGMGVSVDELQDSFSFLLEYSEMPEEEAEAWKNLVTKYMKLSDKDSTDDDTRALRRGILKGYYPLYKKIFFKDYQSDGETPVVVDLFLRYGFLSEEFLSREQLEELLSLDTESTNQGGCHVYDLKEWLQAIYRGEKEPSKNEFDMDYEEFLRDKKKTKEITQQQYDTLMHDQIQKVGFEIDNMFRMNHRLVHGQIMTFVPFLYEDNFSSSVSRLFLSKDKVSAGINRICRVDYSAFYRESLFVKEVEGIKKEYVQKQVYPDVIVLPTVGTKGIMWQELAGRSRSTPGRFLLPVFQEGDLEKILVYLVGCFRWELCRTMQGVYWNNIQIKSLTSEYSDFLQFYRKNKELSEDKKEKLKLQIQKNRNNSREIFASDYGTWIRQESNGAILLSKPVREIMATYCPFSEDYRQKLEGQPMFRDAMARFNRERGKKLREYEMKFRVWEKDRVSVPKEIIETRDFYLNN